MILLGEEQASLLESFAIERVCILEYLADALDRDVLGEDLFASFLEGRYVETIGEGEKLIDILRLYLDSI